MFYAMFYAISGDPMPRPGRNSKREANLNLRCSSADLVLLRKFARAKRTTVADLVRPVFDRLVRRAARAFPVK